MNSISVLCDKVMTARSGGAGSVVAYNYMDDQFIGGDGTWQEIGLNGSHATGSHEMLFEGNQVSNMDSDDTHGNAIDHTFFRNWSTGVRAQFTDYSIRLGIDVGQSDQRRDQNPGGTDRCELQASWDTLTGWRSLETCSAHRA